MKEVFFIVSEHNGVRLPEPKEFHIGSCIDEATVSQAIARFATDIAQELGLRRSATRHDTGIFIAGDERVNLDITLSSYYAEYSINGGAKRAIQLEPDYEPGSIEAYDAIAEQEANERAAYIHRLLKQSKPSDF